MRRGNLLHHADGGSAYLAYKYFIQSGAIKVNRQYMHDIDFKLLSNDIEMLCEELILLFEEGSSLKAVDFVNKLAAFESLTSKELPEELEFLNDFSIPFNIDIQHNTSI